MTGRLISLFQTNRTDVFRWGLSATLVLIAHISVAAAIVGWPDSDDTSDPVGAMVVQLAPTPVAPLNTPSNVLPGPEMQQAEAAPERKAEPNEKHVDEAVQPDVKEQQDIPEQDKPDIALQKKTPEPQPETPTPSEAQLAAPATTAPQMSKVEMAALAAAPNQTQLNLVQSNAVPTWKRTVSKKLNQAAAFFTEDMPVRVLIEFSVAKDGKLRDVKVAQSSGSQTVDMKAVNIVRRAQPFQPPPAEMTDQTLTVPIDLGNKH